MTEDKIYKLYLSPGTKIFLMGAIIFFLCFTLIFIIFRCISATYDSPPALIGIFWLIIIGWNLFYILRLPHEIILKTDGTILFNSILRRIQMKATEIESIRPASGAFGFFIVKGKKKIRLFAQFDNFHEFIFLIKQYNPAVLLKGC